jgi:hypothetical protein
MIKEEKVLISINSRNCTYYEKLGYDITCKKLQVKVLDLPKFSKIKITAICHLCKSENIIGYNKYILNFERNGKNYYSCFNCKNIEKEKTCLYKYGVKSYSMTDKFKNTESEKWKGVQKGQEKGRITCKNKYGVENYFQTDFMRNKNKEWMSSDEFKEKSKNTLIKKYGVESYSKTDEFKKIIYDKKDIISEKIKATFLEKYGNEYLSRTEFWKLKYSEKRDTIIMKIIKTCIERYGVDNISKLDFVKYKSMLTKTERGLIIPKTLLTEWEIYKQKCKNLTKSIKMTLFENWNGYDYYDNELIRNNFCYSSTSRLYPTIDHKISVYYGFLNNISPEIICDISNLCITKRHINSQKNKLIEDEFKKLL